MKSKWRGKMLNLLLPFTLNDFNLKFSGYNFIKVFQSPLKSWDENWKLSRRKFCQYLCLYFTHLSRNYDVHPAVWKCPEKSEQLSSSFIYYLIAIQPSLTLSSLSHHSIALTDVHHKNNNHGLQILVRKDFQSQSAGVPECQGE